MISKLNNSMRWWIRFHGLVLSLSMSPVNLWIIQSRGWWVLPFRDFTQGLGIFFEQGIDHLGDLSGQAAHQDEFALGGPRPLVPAALDRDQSLVELGPFTILLLDGIADDEEEHLLHRAGSRPRQLGAIQRAPRLGDSWGPAKVGFEPGRLLKVVDMPNAGDDRRGLNGTNRRNGGENLPFSRVLDRLHDLSIKLIQMLLPHPQLLNYLVLFDHQAPRMRQTHLDQLDAANIGSSHV